jgi:hypothetical protein
VASVGTKGYVVWVSQLTRGELLDQVLDIEQRLRGLVRSVLRTDASDWEARIPSSVREELRKATLENPRPGTDLLDSASLKQLIDITLGRWKLFAELLKDKAKFSVRLDEFREWRNRLAHGTVPSEDEKMEIVVLLRQVGTQIPVNVGPDWKPPLGFGNSVQGATILWADDHPEWSLPERQILGALGIRVVPALTNDEAVELANGQRFDLVVSDIDRGTNESGDHLPRRLRTLGVGTPIIFYVGIVDPDRAPPDGAEAITADPAILIRDTLMLLSNIGGDPAPP